MTTTLDRTAWPMAVNYSDAVVQRAEWLYAALDSEGWADHRGCGSEDDDESMCGKEWQERLSVLTIAARLMFLEATEVSA